MYDTLPARRTRGASAVLHGRHPMRGYAVTWRLTPLADDHDGASFLVEHADGHIEDDLVWDLAEKETTVMSTEEMRALVRRVVGGLRG